LTIFSIVCLTLTIALSPVLAAPGGTYMVTAINTDIQSDGFVMTISGEDVPVYTVTERFDPFRIIVDVAGESVTISKADGVVVIKDPIPIPTLGQWAMGLMILLLLGFGMAAMPAQRRVFIKRS